MTLNQITFLVLALAAAFGAVGVVFFQSPVRAALGLVLNFFVLGLVYFMLGSQMLGISQIMVYAGAIMVLFLFVIMILKSTQKPEKPEFKDGKVTMAVVLGLGLFAIVFRQAAMPVMDRINPNHDATYGTPQAIGKVLFTQYVWAFEIISILLLVGIVGSIMLAKRKF